MEDCNAEACITQITECSIVSPTQNGHNNIKKRQLPLWMLGVTGVEAASKNETISASRIKESRQSVSEDGSSNGGFHEERRPKRAAERPTKREGSSRTKRTAKGGAEIEIKSNSAAKDDAESVCKETKGSRKGAPRGRRKMKDPQFENQDDHTSDYVEDDIEDPSEGISVENGLDLSVEDLLCMAKQRFRRMKIHLNLHFWI